jgi:hypothetical protein
MYVLGGEQLYTLIRRVRNKNRINWEKIADDTTQ